jgi:hypothetical protein
VPSAGLDSTSSLTGHGSLCDGSTHDAPICSNGNGRSGEDIANQDTVGTHGESGTENPEYIFSSGTVQRHNFAVGTSREGGTDIEDKHGAGVSPSVKIYLTIGCYVDGQLISMDSGFERHAPHFGKHAGLITLRCTSHLPGGQSICGAESGIRR